MRFVIVPGIGDSDDGHWQTIWQTKWGDEASRIAPSSWTEPDLDDWCEAIDREVRAEKDVMIVAHSLGCLAVAHWIATGMDDPIHGAFLVTPPDRYARSFPAAASTFLAAHERSIEVPGLIVCSDDDPYCAPKAAKQMALQWEIPMVNAGALGHISSDSGIDEWMQGQMIFKVFRALTTR
ncbi:serine hydrolase family protein [Kribbella pittospori]|uniref:Serine hydrolase family protein n=1 Tax=Kribbella pittospori TaxID=722689 RepID=A0A4R0K2S7_9ACTN|nr:alpha/beta hydrolase [Kribbella pittospori]TCC52106.1 serine hydrolase family protein [Kribbella pittospori]